MDHIGHMPLAYLAALDAMSYRAELIISGAVHAPCDVSLVRY